MKKILAATGLIAVFALVTVAAPLKASGRRGDKIYPGSYVIAESEFGNGTVRGRVRQTQLGRQVQLPGGSWVYCSNSCTETLRVKTVDFWQSDEGAGPDASITHDVGIFGKLDLNFNW